MTTSKGKESNVGSKSWANKIRSDAKKAVKTLDTGYIEMGRILYTVWDTPVDGDKNNAPIYTLWGYDTYGDYAEGDLGLKRRTAERMRQIWAVLHVQMDIPAELRKKIIALGISKVRSLVPLFADDPSLTKRKVEAWVKAGEKHSVAIFDGMVKKARDELKLLSGSSSNDSSEDEDDSEDEPLGDVNVTDDGDDFHPPAGKPSENRPKGQSPVATSDDLGLPDPEPLEFQHFPLYPDQNEVVKAALQRAEELSGSDKRGHNLTLICTDFISTNDFQKGQPKKSRQRLLKKIEQNLGLKLIALDPSDSSILYGEDTLQKISEEE